MAVPKIMDAGTAVHKLHRDYSKVGASPRAVRWKAQLSPMEQLWARIMRRKLGTPLVFFDAPLNKGDPEGTRALARKMAAALRRLTKRVGGDLKLEVAVQYLSSAGWRVRGYATPLRRPQSTAWRLFIRGLLS